MSGMFADAQKKWVQSSEAINSSYSSAVSIWCTSPRLTPVKYLPQRRQIDKNDISFSPWINGWLNDHSTSILLAGKDDLFYIENKLYWKLYFGSAQYYFFISLMSYPLPVLRTQRKKNEEKKKKTRYTFLRRPVLRLCLWQFCHIR